MEGPNIDPKIVRGVMEIYKECPTASPADVARRLNITPRTVVRCLETIRTDQDLSAELRAELGFHLPGYLHTIASKTRSKTASERIEAMRHMRDIVEGRATQVAELHSDLRKLLQRLILLVPSNADGSGGYIEPNSDVAKALLSPVIDTIATEVKHDNEALGIPYTATTASQTKADSAMQEN